VYHKVKTAKRLFSTGSRTGNENPFLLSVGITWFRHHNWLARQLGGQHSDWSEEKVFNEARLRNIATLQKVVFYDWLPLVLGSCTKCGEITSYTGYKASVSSAISNVFQSAAMNYIDTMVPSAVFVPSNLKRVFGTCNISREDDDNTESDDDS
uniref:Uncharacterized protein n=1 Tax=Ciona savignyi TaxID=51511 RepID=H2ZNH2_CIOSA